MALNKRSFLVLALAFLVSGAHVQANSKPAPWTSQMQKLQGTLLELTPLLSDSKAFAEKKNKKKAGELIQRLSKLSHTLTSTQQLGSDQDPSLKLISQLFAREVDLAYLQFNKGNLNFARESLQSITSYCIACHTRNPSGPQFINLPIQDWAKNLKPLERGDLFTATRQMDRAFEEYLAVIKDSNFAKARPFDWERAIRRALALSVRVKKSSDLALSIVDQVIKTKEAPLYLRDQALTWKTSLESWKTEPSRSSLTEEGLYAEANRLMAQAKALQQYPADHSADMTYLRATAYLHELLSAAPQGAHAAQAFLLLGTCYEVLKDFSLGELNEMFYASCVFAAPHSATAKQCYQLYERSIYVGYSGSGGTYIPDEIRSSLNELELLTQPLSGGDGAPQK